ncbi:MAG: bifunctional phosphoglucose/phosphomannose isomerase [Candidatus Ratteibacteria bacterium]|nr:bifunctional phosphoglucose/phosphomannose isomerase [Candidatus Ratteibacteria bacterium]
MNNIDDVKVIEKIDKLKMRELLREFPYQGTNAVDLMENVKLPPEYKEAKNIVISGMGGSSVGGDLLKNFLRDRIKLPLVVNRSYTLPSWVNKDTLLVCVSYSGNTEETLNTYKIGMEKGCKLVVISSGGELTNLAKKDSVPTVLITDNKIPPRVAFSYLFFPQLFILRMLGFIKIEDKELTETIQTLENLRKELDINVPKNENSAKKIAEEIYKTIPLIYTTSDYMEAVGIRWKTQINENSKWPAYSVFFPELDHNEIMGWEGHDTSIAGFSLILLKDKGESERMIKRINITCSLIEEKLAQIIEVYSKGDGLLARMLSLLYIGDYVSFYLAMLNGVEPIEVKSIMTLKRKMNE